MRTKLFLNTGGIILSLLAFTATSCLENDNLFSNESEEAELTELASVSENESDDVLEVVVEAEASYGTTATRTAAWDYPCATLTNNTETKVLTIDFGTGCVGPYGRTRSGKILVAYNGTLNDGVSNRIITFDQYVVNNKAVTGSIELRDIEELENGDIQSTKKLVALAVIFPNGQSVTYTGNRTRRWIAGVQDSDPTNNVFEITGSVQGTWSNGRTFTHEIVEPIISDWSCAAQGGFARTAGVVEVKRLSGYVNRQRVTDYGDGTCDNAITVTIGARVFQVTEVVN